MRLVTEKGQELVQLRSANKEPLKRLIEEIKDAKQQLENIGLPLKERTRLPEREIRNRVQEKMDQYGAEDGGGSIEKFASFIKNEQQGFSEHSSRYS